MKLHEECGVFGGICFDSLIAPVIRHGLFMLQHRGQESAGICCGDETLTVHKGKGLVMQVLTDSLIQEFQGKSGIGHVRYSTQGASDVAHAQPYMIKYLNENVSIAHNGNVEEAIKMRKEQERDGAIFLTSSDTEMILKKIVNDIRKPPSHWELSEVGRVLNYSFSKGSWSLVLGFSGKVMGFRDPLGYRPLMFCEAEEGYFLSSEDCAFHLLNVKKLIEIQPGEAIEITKDGYKIERFATTRPSKKCVFEHIYFAKPASNIFGKNVYTTRVEAGRQCAIENPVDADIIVPVMDSGFPSAIGYSNASGIPLEMGLLRNHWVGRTFIQPSQQCRKQKVIEKLTPIKSVIEGKRVILVDDSLVRGTTSREIIRMIREAGAIEVHLRLASPKLVNTCLWGVDIPTRTELIATAFEHTSEIADYIEADSIGYLSIDGLKQIFDDEGWCYNCFQPQVEIYDKLLESLELESIAR